MFRTAINDFVKARQDHDWIGAAGAVKTAAEASKLLLAWERERSQLQQDRAEVIPWVEHVAIFRATVGIVAQEFRACSKTLAQDMAGIKDARKGFVVAEHLTKWGE